MLGLLPEVTTTSGVPAQAPRLHIGACNPNLEPLLSRVYYVLVVQGPDVQGVLRVPCNSHWGKQLRTYQNTRRLTACWHQCLCRYVTICCNSSSPSAKPLPGAHY